MFKPFVLLEVENKHLVMLSVCYCNLYYGVLGDKYFELILIDIFLIVLVSIHSWENVHPWSMNK